MLLKSLMAFVTLLPPNSSNSFHFSPFTSSTNFYLCYFHQLQPPVA